MSFKDHLKQAIEDSGGATSDNLISIAELAREIAPDISPAYIRRLLFGQPPRDRDRLALEHALGVDLDEHEERQDLMRFALNNLPTKLEADRFVKFALSNTSFRDKKLSEYDKGIILDQFKNRSKLEIEAELFELDLDSI